MASLLRRTFQGVSGFVKSWKINHSPRSRRTLHRDVEEEEFQYATTHCLSSYYSVFVVRLAIMVMLAILIGLLTLLTWHFTRVYTTRSLETLAYGLRYELLQRPILRMWNILNSTVEVTTAQVKLSEYVMRRYSKPVNQAEQLELYEVMKHVTWPLFASRRALNSITINYRNGFVQAFHRDHRSSNTYYIYSDLVNYSISESSYDLLNLSSFQGWDNQSVHGNYSAIWYREPLDPTTGERIGKPSPIPPDDIIIIAGLSQVPDAAASWQVSVSKYTDSPLLSAALPVWDSSNKSIMAVVGVTTALYSVGQLMRELVEVHSGHIYLTSQEGWLLATSSNTPLLMNTTKGPKLMMAVNSEDPVIRAGAMWLEKAIDNKSSQSQEVHIENARLGDQLYYIDSFFLNLRRLPMVGVLIIPRKYIMGRVDERALKTMVILISASLCIIVIGCVCIFVLTNGVSKEMKLRAELISHLDARRKAEASSNYKSQFLANMSHELRTPMAAVIGLLDILLCDDCLNNEQYATITQIRKCSTALLRLLNNILDLSKVESGKLVLEETEFDLVRELEGLVDMFSVQCINHNVETVLDLSDDMPKLVTGDSGRVVQIFANLISNSIKFTTSGHIILRGWCETPTTFGNSRKFFCNQKDLWSAPKTKLKQFRSYGKSSSKKDKMMILWFEIDDTGCGIDPSKWESIFESFEQADPSTTRLHGGTGLGLCIVRTLVNTMGGEIRVVKKNGPGTVMKLCLLLSTPIDSIGKPSQLKFSECNLTLSMNFTHTRFSIKWFSDACFFIIKMLLALNGKMGRLIMSRWLRTNGVCTLEASDWNELTQVLQEVFQGGGYVEKSPNECPNEGAQDMQSTRTPIIVIVIDIGILDLSTDIWKEQLNFLNKYYGSAKFAWILNHDTSNTVKMELRSKGRLLMVNRPLYKAKMIQILEAIMKERDLELQRQINTSVMETGMHEYLEIDHIHSESESSEDSVKSVSGRASPATSLQADEGNRRENFTTYAQVSNCFLKHPQNYSKENNLRTNDTSQTGSSPLHDNSKFQDENLTSSCFKGQGSVSSSKMVNEQRSLEGLRILLAEDNPLLQRVATIMLEKMGAMVVAVGDGLLAVDALKFILSADEHLTEIPMEDGAATARSDSQPYDLILMDCQMPKMDGYEATKAIRKSEVGTGSHIPIVALTAHAMSSDEAKCLEVGMDAYLTKPIDCKLMISTIRELTTKRTAPNCLFHTVRERKKN